MRAFLTFFSSTVKIFVQAIDNSKPIIGLTPFRKGGAVVQVSLLHYVSVYLCPLSPLSLPLSLSLSLSVSQSICRLVHASNFGFFVLTGRCQCH